MRKPSIAGSRAYLARLVPSGPPRLTAADEQGRKGEIVALRLKLLGAPWPAYVKFVCCLSSFVPTEFCATETEDARSIPRQTLGKDKSGSTPRRVGVGQSQNINPRRTSTGEIRAGPGAYEVEITAADPSQTTITDTHKRQRRQRKVQRQR